MTDKQRRFADEYLIDCNATRAYKEAYPHVKRDSAAAAAANYFDERFWQISSAKIAKTAEVLEYLTSVVRGETQSEVVVVEGGGDGCSEVRLIFI